MSIFEKFDAQIDINKIEEQKNAVRENTSHTYESTPAGQYYAMIEKMELGTTKDGRPMFKVAMRLTDGVGETEKKFLEKFKIKKPLLFMNRVVFGTRNDGSMIKSVETWVNKLGFDEPLVFTNYSDFASDIDYYNSLCDNLECEIEYNPDAFNSISIIEVYELN